MASLENISNKSNSTILSKISLFINKKSKILKSSLKYLIIRGIGLGIYFGISYVLVENFFMNAVIATMIGFFVSFLFNYFFGYYWVFKSKKSHNIVFTKYIIMVALAFLLNTLIMYLSVEVFHWWYIYGLVIATFIVPTFNFLVSYFWTFK